jgi:hypothetical protein
MNDDTIASAEAGAVLALELVVRRRRADALSHPLDVTDKIEIGTVFADLEREAERVREHARALAAHADANTFAEVFVDLVKVRPWMRIESHL